MRAEITNLVEDFTLVAKLADIPLSVEDVSVETLFAPHSPPTQLPAGKMAVYVFCHQGRALKVGKAGPNSNARYTSQHYSPRAAPSTLAASVLKRGMEIGVPGMTYAEVGDWVKASTDRHNFLLDNNYPIRLLTLLESFLQCKLDPVFEGFSSQK